MNVTFNAVKNLIPETVECEFDMQIFKTCKDSLLLDLERIRDSSDIEENIVLRDKI